MSLTEQGKPCTMKTLGDRTYSCPVELALQIIGGKWKPVILYHLGQDGTMRFSQLRRIMPAITQKMLTRQLRELETDRLVHRKVYPQVPPKVEYSMTELGMSVMPVLQQLCQWGQAFERHCLAQQVTPDEALTEPVEAEMLQGS